MLEVLKRKIKRSILSTYIGVGGGQDPRKTKSKNKNIEPEPKVQYFYKTKSVYMHYTNFYKNHFYRNDEAQIAKK